MSHKSVPSMLFLLAVAMIALMGLSPARQAWPINVWSLQYAHHTLSPAAEQSAALPDPPAGHARAAFWQASAALHLRGNPALAGTLIFVWAVVVLAGIIFNRAGQAFRDTGIMSLVGAGKLVFLFQGD